MKSSLLNRRHLSAAFSLIEIVLAVGIISFALVGILGLFPVALQSASDAQNETQVAFIARSIYSELGSTPAFLSPGTEVDLTTAQSLPAREYNEAGELLGEGDPNPNSTAGTAPVFEATITLTPDDPSDGLTRVDVVIATPAEAPAGSIGRSEYPFVSLVRQPTPTTPPAEP